MSRLQITWLSSTVEKAESAPLFEVGYGSVTASTHSWLRAPESSSKPVTVGKKFGQIGITANAGTGLQPSAKGILTFGAARVDGRLVRAPFAGWAGFNGVGGTPRKLGYILTAERTATFRPRQPTDGRALRVLATPRVATEAGPHGLIPLQVEGEQVTARVVGVIERFP